MLWKPARQADGALGPVVTPWKKLLFTTRLPSTHIMLPSSLLVLNV